MNLRKRARGQPCYVRLSGCDGGGETTVLAHLPWGNLAGMGQKAPDTSAVPACYNCHQIIDGAKQHPFMQRGELRLAAYEGQQKWLRDCLNNGWIVIA